jgi:hypothetical protein
MSDNKRTPGGTFDPAWLEAGADRARSLVDEAKDRAGDLVAAWVTAKNVAAVFAIASDDRAPTVARKAARRGVNVLKSRGVAMPERAHVAGAPVEEEVTEAWFRPPDAAGTSAFTVGGRMQGRYRLIDVILKRGAGIVSIATMQMSRSQLRTTFDDIAKRFGAPPALVPIEWARARIEQARQENLAAGTPVPLGFDSHRDLLGPAPTEALAHPVLTAALPAVDPKEALERSGKLHAEPEMRAWLPEPPSIQKMLIAISQSVGGGANASASAEAGVGPVGGAQAKVRDVIEKATDVYFTREVRVDLRERMLDAALSMAARGASDRAADLLAIVDVVRSSDDAPHTLPFLRAFFEKAFGIATARAARQRA